MNQLLDGFYKSFTEPKAYQGFLENSSWRVFGHTVLVALVITLLVGYPVATGLNRGVNEAMSALQSDVPDFQLNNGKLTIYSDMPILIREGDFLFIADTTGGTTRDALANSPTGILITESVIYHKKSSVEISEFNLAQVQGRITKDHIMTWLPYLRWITPLVLTGLLAFYLMGNLLVALISAGIYSISDKGKIKGVNFGDCYKLMLYSQTLPRMLIGVFALVSLSIPYYFVLTLILTVYLAHRGVQELDSVENLIPPITTT